MTCSRCHHSTSLVSEKDRSCGFPDGSGFVAANHHCGTMMALWALAHPAPKSGDGLICRVLQGPSDYVLLFARDETKILGALIADEYGTRALTLAAADAFIQYNVPKGAPASPRPQ